jgi:phosphoribosylformylglycinamidine cyclo-ligase
VAIDRGAWEPPAIFPWLAQIGNIDREEMYRVFNMGIGFTLVVRPGAADSVQKRLARHEIKTWVLGTVEAGEHGVAYLN